MKKINGLSQPSICIDDLEPEASSWKVYPINDKWTEEIYPLIETDRKFARLVKEALKGFLKGNYEDRELPEDWSLWNGKAPWVYGRTDYYDEVINKRVDDFIHSDDPEAIELKALIESRAEGHESINEIYRTLAWRFEPEVDSAEYFRVCGSCHWISEPLAYAVKKLRPEARIVVVESLYHTFCADLDAEEIFDFLIFAPDHPVCFARSEEEKHHFEDIKAGYK